jgi:hypothetical protein
MRLESVMTAGTFTPATFGLEIYSHLDRALALARHKLTI